MKMHSIALLTSILFTAQAMSMEKSHILEPTKKDMTLSRLVLGAMEMDPEFKPLWKRDAGYWTGTEQESQTGFFNRLAKRQPQREDWYSITPFIAEFWCAISNIPLIYVGLQYNSPEVVFAGLASFIYHSCPKQWLLQADRLGVFLVFFKFAREYAVLRNNPILLALPVFVLLLNALDVYLGQNYRRTWPHVAWHLSAALMTAVFLSYCETSC